MVELKVKKSAGVPTWGVRCSSCGAWETGPINLGGLELPAVVVTMIQNRIKPSTTELPGAYLCTECEPQEVAGEEDEDGNEEDDPDRGDASPGGGGARAGAGAAVRDGGEPRERRTGADVQEPGSGGERGTRAVELGEEDGVA